MSRFKHQLSKKIQQTPSIQLLLQLILSEKTNLRAFFIFSVASGFLLLAIPFAIQLLVQHLSLLYYQQSTVFVLLVVVIFLIGIGLLRALQLLLNERLQRRLFYDLGRDMSHRLQKILQKKKANLKAVNVFFEVVTLQKTFSALLFDGLTVSIQAVLGLLVITIYHPLFFIYSLSVTLALYFVLRVLGAGVFDLSLKESKHKYEFIAHLQSLTETTDAPSQQMTDQLLSNYFWARENKFRLFFKQSLGLVVVQILASCLLLSIGGLLVMKNKMTLGQFIAGELIISNVLLSLFKFSNILDYWYDTLVSLHKINETLTELENDVESATNH